ncbi:hypothetical protein HPB47_027860 [Ixodes persulcatus]|uniref:Uncharacterized protein n=1 Tax=Ixodes persulcatus TaxID=34615 RepID=A0AC60PW30_IXOPE|nr:hypothetical protein HPB47_027860 [Ixodes persulcatus]
MTEPEHPTRMGNSVSRDTCPDLTLVRTQTSCSWSNLDETLGSEHYILETEVCDGGRRTRKLRPARLTNWDQLRQQRGSTERGDIISIQEWTQRLYEGIDRATKKVHSTMDTPAIDPHLLHLLGTILRSLLDPSRSKTETSKAVTKLLHGLQRDEPSIVKELESRYLAAGQRRDYAEYPYSEEAELRAPQPQGKDGDTYKMLHNLHDDASITALTRYFNEVWRTGRIPEEWKHADITLISKPGKRLGLQTYDAFRLRLEQEYFADTMYGFRPRLSTQDVLLQLTEEVLNFQSQAQAKAVLAIDLKGAFDNVSHDAILRNLTETHCSTRAYNYVRCILMDRTATLGIGDNRSDPVHLTGRGTPQGSVVSPLLFNVAMAGLPHKLNETPHLRHALYTHDITVWTTTGSEGEIQCKDQKGPLFERRGGWLCARGNTCPLRERARRRRAEGMCTLGDGGGHPEERGREEFERERSRKPYFQDRLQEAVNVTQDYAGAAGLTIASENSKLLVIRKRSVLNKHAPTIDLTLGNTPIPRVERLRILGMYLQKHEGTRHTVELLRRQTDQIAHLIRRAVKTALGLRISTPTKRLLILGVHNTVKELVKAQKTGELTRLSATQTGRATLRRLGYTNLTQEEPTAPARLKPDILKRVQAAPIPKNMHPYLHTGRREARVRVLENVYGPDPQTWYTDTALHSERAGAATIVVTDKDGTCPTCSILNIASIQEAEEMAIALDISHAIPRRDTTDLKHKIIIITDSQAACRALAGNTLYPRTAHLINAISTEWLQIQVIRVIWTPAHLGLSGNERCSGIQSQTHPRTPSPFRVPTDTHLNTYHLVTEYYQTTHRVLPPPHRELSRAEAADWRQLQTFTLPNLHQRHRWFPNRYPGTCPGCGSDRPNAALSGTELDDQQRLVEPARRIWVANEALD